MEAKKNGDLNKNGGTTNSSEGWLFRFIQEGWLRKRWRKRWCVLKEEKLYLFEFQSSNDTDKNCGCIDLKYYQKCVHAGKKESKKSKLTMVLEVAKRDDKNQTKSKIPNKINRELFYADDVTQRDRWFEKLNEAIAIARMGGGKNLEHVTKTRAKPPGARRRPPTRKHLHDRAQESELSSGLDAQPEQKPVSVKRGHVPTIAIKPLPPGGLKPPAASPAHSNADIELENETEAQPSPLPSPKPSPRPPPPSKALKPKLVTSELADLVESEDDSSLAPSPVIELMKSETPTSSRASSCKGSTQSLDRRFVGVGLPRSAPGSLMFKQNGTSDTRAMLLKAQTLERNQKLSDFGDGVPLGRKGKSQSMVILDTIDDDLPPPPDLPPGSDSNVERDEKSQKKKDKKVKKKKKEKKKRPKSTNIVSEDTHSEYS